MIKQFQFSRLAYQQAAVDSIAAVFNDVRFIREGRRPEMNPVFGANESADAIKRNITQVREQNQIDLGAINVASTATPVLNLDVLMETGTGKTFTFIETMYKLNQRHGLSKFIILVPSNAIRQGTLKSLANTAPFFAKEYNNQKVQVFNYSNRTVQAFIHNANANISVLVATYQSFNKDKNTINQRGVEANLFGRAKSYMEALAVIRPVLIIDEPHRFEGKQTQTYLEKFNPLFTLRFGATFKGEYTNLIYTLDSLAAFRQRLVKSITVDTVGNTQSDANALCFVGMTGAAGERTASIAYTAPSGKHLTVEIKVKGNLGQATDIGYLDAYVIENITAKEVLFTNGFALPLGEPSSYGMLADETQRLIVQRSVENHFEREEVLFKQGIKALSLFFIDGVAKYMPEKGKPAVLRDLFESAYAAQLKIILDKPALDKDYRAYLERTQSNIAAVHKGYFARSHSEKGEEEAIKLILEEKEKLLSFDTDLRFIFSMWALQEGWDNPNIFTLCKLAPSNSKITKLQQIGRGLRLAVNQNLERITQENGAFDEVNELVVVVPASEGDFVQSIQDEIAAHSVQRVAKVFNDTVLAEFGVTGSTRVANRVLDALLATGVIALDDLSGQATIVMNRNDYNAQRDTILSEVGKVQGANAVNMQAYLDAYFEGYGRVKHKTEKPPVKMGINPSQYAKFRTLWENLNRDAVVRYDLNTPILIETVVATIEKEFNIAPLGLSITRSKAVEMGALPYHSVEQTLTAYELTPYSIFSLGEFVRDLSNASHLSYETVARVLQRMSPAKFSLIAKNENRALSVLKDIFIWAIYELIINKVSYQLREVRVKTAMTDIKGALLDSLAISLCGKETHEISNQAVRMRSLYTEAFMPVDSKIEKITVDESNLSQITVFAKLPKINIPTPVGDYNPDFGFAITNDGSHTLYLVVETKGFDTKDELGKKEAYKVECAKQFFQSLKATGINVAYKTKLNGETLVSIIQSIDKA